MKDFLTALMAVAPIIAVLALIGAAAFVVTKVTHHQSHPTKHKERP